MTPPADLKNRILAAATGQAKPRPALLSRIFWAAAAAVLLAVVVGSLTHPSDYHVETVKGPVAGRLEWKDRSVRLSLAGLPALPEGKVYQLWQIGPEAAALPAKTFTLDPIGQLLGSDTMKYPVAKGQTFALTMEPPGGSLKPTAPLYFAVVLQ